MNQLFISYSRKDTDFARNLTTHFEAEGLEAWVDWQDIPPSVDWMKEIQKGIEEADIFLLLVSPDSIRSSVCAEEVAHAIKNGKRIIPIIVREIDVKEAPATISHMNWVFFSRPEDNFKESFEKVLLAIRTDYDWVEAHRRLQVKALEWEENQKEASYLLRGVDLQDAEAQLRVNGEKDPRPTDLQFDYVSKSSEAEKRQIEEQRAKEQQLMLEKNMSLRLRRVTYLVLGISTLAFFALFIWLNQVTSDLAIKSIKDQMLALVETSVSVIDGDKFESLITTYPKPGNSVRTDTYYQALSFFINNIKSSNKNIEAQITLYVIAKGNSADEFSVIASTMEETPFRFSIANNSPTNIHIVGMGRTIADPNTVYKNEHGGWICSCTPIFNSNNRSVGALCADFSSKLLDDTRKKVATTLGIAFLAIYPAMIALVIFSTRSVSKMAADRRKKQQG